MLGGPCVRLSPLSCSLRWPYAFIIIKGLLFSYAKERLVSSKVPVFSGLTLSLNPEYFPLPGSLCLWQWEINQALNELDLFLPRQSQEFRGQRGGFLASELSGDLFHSQGTWR